MIRKMILPISLSLLSLTLAGCLPLSNATTIPPTATDTTVPPTATVAPSATPIPPSETPTEVPPTATATPTTPPEGVIEHFPAGQEFTVTTIHMIDANSGWATGGLAGVGDHVLKTADGGSTWTDLTPPEPAPASGDQKVATAYFQDAQIAWVTYAYTGFIIPSQAVVWRTQDGGQTWLASQPLDISGLAEVYVPSDLLFVGGQTGWLLVHVGAGMNHDYVALFRSQDGGVTWTRLLDPYNDGGIQSCSKSAILFTDATHGWLTGDCNGVAAGVLLFKSTDGGATWQEVVLPDPTSALGLFEDMNVACGSYDPFFFSNDLGHLGVRCTHFAQQPSTLDYYIYTTQDGGATWTSSTYPGIALYFVTADTGWSLAPKIQRTTDGGATWTPISDVIWTAQMDFISEQIGWGVARADNQVALVKTDSGGEHWSILTPTIGP